MKPKMNLAVAGRYAASAMRPDGSRRQLASWFDNLVLDTGLNRLGVGAAWAQCKVGTGSTAPENDDTALATPVVTTSNVLATVGGVDNTEDPFVWARRTFRFPVGAATGTLSEVGVGWSDGLFSRALIADEEGNPTTITVLEDEALEMTYEVRAFPNMAEQVASVNISGTPYDFTFKPALFAGDENDVNNWPAQLISILNSGLTSLSTGMQAFAVGAALGAVDTGIAGTQIGTATGSFNAGYVTDSHERDCRMTFGLGGGVASFGGLQLVSQGGCYQITVDPVIPKTATNVLTLDFKLAWSRRGDVPVEAVDYIENFGSSIGGRAMDVMPVGETNTWTDNWGGTIVGGAFSVSEVGSGETALCDWPSGEFGLPIKRIDWRLLVTPDDFNYSEDTDYSEFYLFIYGKGYDASHTITGETFTRASLSIEFRKGSPPRLRYVAINSSDTPSTDEGGHHLSVYESPYVDNPPCMTSGADAPIEASLVIEDANSIKLYANASLVATITSLNLTDPQPLEPYRLQMYCAPGVKVDSIKLSTEV